MCVRDAPKIVWNIALHNFYYPVLFFSLFQNAGNNGSFPDTSLNQVESIPSIALNDIFKLNYLISTDTHKIKNSVHIIIYSKDYKFQNKKDRSHLFLNILKGLWR